MFATSAERWLYQKVAKPIFFRFDPEQVHDRIVKLGARLGRWRLTRWVTERLFSFAHSGLRQEILGLDFPNPVGLTAGFDKNATLIQTMPAVGFGFVEVGSITGEPCAGNPKPRLWRLPKTQGLVVYYGLKNDGCEVIASRLRQKKFEIPVGVSIAKTNSANTVEVSAGIQDYLKAFRAFLPIADYFTVNISCPNAYGGEPFTDPVRLEQLLSALDLIEAKQPIFLKLPVDLTMTELENLLLVIDSHRVHGLVISNLTKRRDRPEIVGAELNGLDHGGISGRPTFAASNDLISYVFKTRGSRYVLIGSGGIFSAEDAYEKIIRGASLVQLATGLIFEGPQVIGEINRDLVKLLERDGFKNISEAIGSKK